MRVDPMGPRAYARSGFTPPALTKPSQTTRMLLASLAAFVFVSALLGLTAYYSSATAFEASRDRGPTDALGIAYATRLDNGTSAAAHTRLYDDPRDRELQIAALREDDGYAYSDIDGIHSVAYAENKALFPVCNSAINVVSAVRCNGRNGYILHLALRGYATSAQQAAAIDGYGVRWAAIFGRLHPQNAHCALIVLASAATAEDDTQNDDAGDEILRAKCFPTRP